MNTLTLVECIKKKRPDYATLHLRAAQRAGGRYLRTRSRTDILKAVNHGVRAVVAHKKKSIEPKHVLRLCNHAIVFMRLITPRELMQIFPIEKRYNGDKSGIIDYYYTMKALKDYDIYAPIGEYIDEFLMDYANPVLHKFQVMRATSGCDLIRQVTGECIVENFCRENGIKTYLQCRDEEVGKDYLYDSETGETFKFEKPIPRYMKLLKGGKSE